MNFPEITTDRLKLRKVRSADKDVIFKGLSNPEINRYLVIHFTTMEEAEEQLEFYQHHWQKQTGIFWAIDEKKSGRMTGVIGIYDINQQHKRAELGYWLLPEFHGKKFIKEAGNTVLDYAYNQLGLNRIYAQIIEENSASRATIRKLGFIEEGNMREYEVNPDGEFANLMIYSRLRSDLP